MDRHPKDVDDLSTLKSKLFKSVLKHFNVLKDPILIPGGYEEAIVDGNSAIRDSASVRSN